MDVVCLGELLVDMFPDEDGKRLEEVSAFRPKPGGAPANVAVSLSRLGARSAFVGKVGDDAFGRHLAQVLALEGVDIRGIRYDDTARTTMAFIAKPDPHTAEFLFYRNPGADTRLEAGELDVDLLSTTKALHFGSLSLVEEPIRTAALAAVDIARPAGAMISLDVNYRPTLWPSPEAAHDEVMAVLPRVNLLKVNEVELALLTGQDDPVAGSEKLLRLGPSACVVTLGAEGSFFRTPQGYGRVPGFDVRTIDTTGSGDAFISGLLTQMVTLGDWLDQLAPEAMHTNLLYANAVGGLTAQTQGAIPALPTAAAVEAFLDQQPRWRDSHAETGR